MTETRQEPTLFAAGHVRRPPPPRPRSANPIAFILLLAVVLAGVAWFWFGRPAQEVDPTAIPQAEVARPTSPAVVDRPPELLPAEPGSVLPASGILGALDQFLGREAVLRFLVTTDFPRKAVATLDNLGREHAPVAAWPVVPAPGRFLADGDGASAVVSIENADRYRPFVAFIDSIDTAGAVDLYRRMYPVLQQAYRELGFGDRSLHSRLFEVINLLLATPEPVQTPRVTLTQVKGPVPSTQPWTRYEYEDPAFQRLTAGQKILLRVGPENRRVLKAKLEEIRRELLRASAGAMRP
jgi:hypothetical protein